jgi:hypothetical protein
MFLDRSPAPGSLGKMRNQGGVFTLWLVVASFSGSACNAMARPDEARGTEDAAALEDRPVDAGVATPSPAGEGPFGDPSFDGGASFGPTFGGGQGPHFESIDENYDALLELGADVAGFFCECEVLATSGPDFDECVASYVRSPAPPVLYCSKEVYSQSDAASEALDCELDLANAYADCVKESTCLDFDHIFECETERIIADLGCEDIPYVVWAQEQERCLGRDMPEPFECANGNLINPTWACDFEDDCGDNSDETGCDPHAGLTTTR